MTDPNVVFDLFCTSSSKIKKAAFSNFKPPKNNETKISEIISEHRGSLNSKYSTKIKARFDIFLRRKAEIEAELEELLCYERNENVQPATIKLRAIDLKERLTSLGVDNWINNDLDQIDPIELSNWEDQISKNIARVLYGAEEKITIRKGLAQTGLKKEIPPSSMVSF